MNKFNDLPPLFRITILTLFYFLTAKATFLFATIGDNVTLIWPAAGVALAALLIFGYGLWPAIAIGAFLTVIDMGSPVDLALITAVGATLEALAGTYLLKRAGFEKQLSHIWGVANFIFFGAIVSSVISASIGTVGLCLSGLIPWSAYFSNWGAWWLSNAVGILLFTPAILTWFYIPPSFSEWTPSKWLEAIVIFCCGLTAGLFVFGSGASSNSITIALVYLPLPALLWAALRFGPTGAATMNLLVNMVALIGTATGVGPFNTGPVADIVFLLWAFLVVSSLTSLSTAAVMAEREQANSALSHTTKALQESEKRLTEVISSAMDAIVTVDETQHIVLFNKAAETVFGYTADEAIGQPLSHLIPTRFQEGHRQNIQQFGQNGVTSRRMGEFNTLWGVRANGEEFPIEASISKVVTSGQTLYTALVRDITIRKSIEQELEESRAQMAGIITSAMDAIITINETHHILLFNTAAEKMFGRTAAEVIGQSIDQFIPHRFHRTHTQYIKSFGQNGTTNRRMGALNTLWGVHANGKEFPIEASISKVKVTDQMLYTVIVRDITKQKEIEAALRESEERFRYMITAMAEGIVLHNSAGQITFANSAAEKVLGLSIGQMMGLTPVDPQWHTIHEDGSPFPGETHPAAVTLRTGKPMRDVIMGVHKPDGALIWISVNSQPLKRPDEQVPYAVVATFHDITERKRVENALRESEERYRSIVEDQTEFVVRWLPNGIRTFVNDSYCAYFHIKREEALGTSFFEHIIQGDRVAVHDKLEALTPNNPVRYDEHQVYLPDGTIGWQYWIDRAIFDESGQLIEYQSVGRDITEQKRAAEALRQSEERFRQLAENINEVFWMTNVTKDQMLYISPAYEKIWGRSCASLYKTPLEWLESIHPDDQEHIKEAISRQVDGRYDEEYRVVQPDGSIRWVHDRAFPITAAAGQTVRIVGVARDITERKKAENALRESESRNRAMLNAMPDFMFVQTRDGVYLDYHTSDPSTLYAPPELFLGKPMGDFFPKEHTENILKIFEQVLATEEIQIWEYQLAILGAERHFEARMVPYGEDKILSIIREITEQKELEAQLLQAQKMESIGRLAGGIAHDFNNLLVPIMSYVDLSLMGIDPDSKIYSYLTQVKKAAARSADLTRQILAFSRKQVLEMQVLNLNETINDFHSLIQRLIGENISLQTFLEPTLYKVKADKGQIEQVIMNLVVNARDAMPNGGHLTIETDNVYLDESYIRKYAGAQPPGQYAMIAISDTGDGMDEATQKQIFEPFFTTKEQGKGTGLGLATVFGIVKQHGGNIWVYSEPSKGTTFKIYLPHTEDATNYEQDSRYLEPNSIYGSETILVVEDEEMVRKLVCETLVAYGYHVIEAQNCRDSLQYVSQSKTPIQLLLSDVVMPEMNGRELYYEIQKHRPDIKVLYMSGYTDDIIVHHGILDEGVNFIQKPFTIHNFLRTIKNVLRD